MLIACTAQEMPDTVRENAPLRFNVSAASKAAFTAGLDSLFWRFGDRIGIHAERDGLNVGVNYPYSVSSDGASAGLTALTSAWQYGSSDAAACTFYAYYPFAGTAGEGNRFVVPASISSSQRQKAAGDASHLGEYLLMKSAPATADENGAVNLRFRNLCAVAEIKLKAEGGCNRRVTSAVLKASAPVAFDKGSLLVQASPDGSESPLQINEAADSVTLELATPLTLSAEAQSIYFCLLPGSHEASSLKLRLIADDGCEALLDLGTAVDFKANGIYRKSVGVTNQDFGDAVPVRYVWKPVVKASDVTAGEYLISYYHLHEGKIFMLPNTPVTRNPVPAEMNAVAPVDGAGNVTEVQDGYSWEFAEVTGGWQISCKVSGNTNILGACDQAQGVAISADGSGYYASSKTYGTVWTVSDLARQWMEMSVSVTTRKLMPYPVDEAYQWRMTGESNTGGFVFYKKTAVYDN